jgi:hypothetical protein
MRCFLRRASESGCSILGRSSRKWVTYPVKEQENGQMDAPRRCTAELTGIIQVGLFLDDAGDLLTCRIDWLTSSPHLHQRPGRTGLPVGCGSGRMLIYI